MSGYYPEGAAHDPRAPWNDDDDLDEFREPDPDEEFERLRERAFEDADDYRKYGREGL